MICKMSVWFFWFFSTKRGDEGGAVRTRGGQRRASTEGVRECRRCADARRRRATARTRVGRRARGASSGSSQIRHASRRKDARTGRGVWRRRASTRRRGTGTRAYLGDPRVEIQTLPHDRPRASCDDSGPASASSRPREWFCGAARSREPPGLRPKERWFATAGKKPRFTGARFTAQSDSKHSRDKLARRDTNASETDSTRDARSITRHSTRKRPSDLLKAPYRRLEPTLRHPILYTHTVR